MSNELDKQFSDKLLGYESIVDAEALWEVVQPNRKKRRWGWLWLLLVIGTVGAGTGWWYLAEQNKTVIASTVTAPPPVKAENELSPEGMKTKKNKTLESQIDESTERNPGITAPPTAANSESQTAAKNTIVTTTTASDPAILKGSSIQQQIASTQPTDRSITDKEDSKIERSPSNVEIATIEISEPTKMNKNELELIAEKNRIASDKTNFIPTLEAGLLAKDQAIVLPAISSPEEESYRSRRSPWFLELNAGYYLLNRTLEMSGDSLYGNWLNKREQTERILEANSFDVTLGYELSDKWQLRSGISYTQLNTSFNYTTSSIVTDTINGVQVIVYEGNTIVDSIMGPVARYTTTLQEKRTYNSFRQLEIPLLVAYNFGKGKLHYQAEGGLRLLLQRKWEGDILNVEDEFLDLSQSDWYRNTLSLSFQAGLKAVYDLNAQTAVVGGLNIRYYPQAFTTDEAPFTERYQLSGLTIGLKHRF